MKKIILSCCLITFCVTFSFSQIKKQYEDEKQKGRTVVVKTEGSSDVEILNQQFGDVPVGKVIRITTEKAPRTKTPKTKTQKTPPPKLKKSVKPKLKKKPKVSPPPPPQRQRYFGVGSFRKIKTKKRKLRKLKRTNNSKQRSCFGF